MNTDADLPRMHADAHRLRMGIYLCASVADPHLCLSVAADVEDATMTCGSERTGAVAAAVALTIASLPGVALRLTAQSGTPAEVAAKLTGRWKLNTELTPTSTKPGRGRGGPGGAASLASASAPVQRGGRGGGGGGGGGQPGDASAPLMAEEVA